MHINAHRKVPRPFKQYSLISMRLCEKYLLSLVCICTLWSWCCFKKKQYYKLGSYPNSSSLISSYLITCLKDYLSKPYTLYKFQSSNPLQNITSVVQFQQDTLQLCKLESEKDELFINYFHAAAKGSSTARVNFINQIANTMLHTGNRREYFNPHHSLIYFTVLWTNRV